LLKYILILYIAGILLCDFLFGLGPWQTGEWQRQDAAVSAVVAHEVALFPYADTLRSQCGRLLAASGLSSTTVGLAQGVLLGNKQALDAEQKQAMRAAGMSHLLAVSGLHIGIIWVLISILLRPLVLLHGGFWHRWLILLFLWGYIAVIGFPVSAIRAGIMITLVQISFSLQRNVWGFHNLINAALLILLGSPSQIYEPGFQLSFLATAGILTAAPWLRQSRSVLGRLLIITLSAQFFTLPLVAYYFHTVPVFGWVQGVLVVPVMGVFIYLLLLLLLFTGLGLPATPLVWSAEQLSQWIGLVARYTGSFETWCLGGRLSFYPSLLETLLMLFVLVISAFFVRRYFSPIGR